MSLQGPIWLAARALFAADNGSTGLNNSASPAYVTSFNYLQAGQQQARPYVVFSIVSDRSNDGKAVDIQESRIAFNVYSDSLLASPGNVYTILKRLRTVYHRIASTQTISSVNYNVWFQRASGNIVPESESVFHHVEVYKVMVTGQ